MALIDLRTRTADWNTVAEAHFADFTAPAVIISLPDADNPNLVSDAVIGRTADLDSDTVADDELTDTHFYFIADSASTFFGNADSDLADLPAFTEALAALNGR